MHPAWKCAVVVAMAALGSATAGAQSDPPAGGNPRPVPDFTGKNYWLAALASFPSCQDPFVDHDATVPDSSGSACSPEEEEVAAAAASSSAVTWGISTFENYVGSPYPSEPVEDGVENVLKVSYLGEDLSGPELHLLDIEMYSIDGLRRYAAVWGAGPGSSVLASELSFDQLEKGRDGYRLADFECSGSDGEESFLAVYHPATADDQHPPEIQRLSWSEIRDPTVPGCILDLEYCSSGFIALVDGARTCEVEVSVDPSPQKRWEEFHDRFHRLLYEEPSEKERILGQQGQNANPLREVVELEYFDAVGYVAVLGVVQNAERRDWLMVTDAWGRLRDELRGRIPTEEREKTLELRDLVLGVPAIPPANLKRSPQHKPLHGDGPNPPPK